MGESGLLQRAVQSRTNDQAMKTPVLFLLFNRPRETAISFKSIQSARPTRLFIAADGARANKKGEATLCEQARNVVRQIDWDCEVSHLMRDSNRGCELGVSEAISWFFSHVESGIIIEDDCVADIAFFEYCSHLLNVYKSDPHVGAITGNNFQKGTRRGSASFYASKYFHCWGWATWQDRWDKFDFTMTPSPSYPDAEIIRNFSSIEGEREYWLSIFRRVRQGKIKTWDYRWLYNLWKNRLLTITPQINLVQNIGFGENATHTRRGTSPAITSQCEIAEFTLPVNLTADAIAQDIDADAFCARSHYRIRKGWKARLSSLLTE